MLNTNWRTGTRVRVSPEVPGHLGPEGAMQVALHLKGQGPEPTRRDATLATAYGYVNRLELAVALVLLEEAGGEVPVFLIATREQWAEWHLDRQSQHGSCGLCYER